ncbi:leucine-rich repeat extensin-like protein 3 [Iris pallida]|uniref:Leucine-rich repeat extensin-like protein 3 n=1 Tax=Iris pallida TaxID=29817 RepID=A0AAX6G428_IRIPA|nr:leucine-rich repeat extensin-like protein 3 [Iris pallida]
MTRCRSGGLVELDAATGGGVRPQIWISPAGSWGSRDRCSARQSTTPAPTATAGSIGGVRRGGRVSEHRRWRPVRTPDQSRG